MSDCNQCGKRPPYCRCAERKPMSDSMQLTTTQPVGSGDLVLSATTPVEMQECQLGLIEWCRRKILAVRADAEDLMAAFREAKQRKWKTSTLQRHAGLAAKRVQFYEKIMAALENGFILVPNFPVQMFAIRTDRDEPKRDYYTYQSSYKPNPNKEQKGEALPAGEGEYQNPFPVVVQKIHQQSDGKGGTKTLWETWAEAWADLDFPINMAKAHIMQATDNAMALKIFDELGVLPSPYKKKDPLIVGRIRDPRASKHDRDGVVTFIVAWHLDTRTL